MSERLSWDAIKRKFDQQWVVLTDYDWPDGTPYPASGVVGIHAREKKDFDKLLRERRLTHPNDIAVVYVGTPPRNPNELFINLYTLTKCE
jgi:hypothetical protein